ncbi:hypothetical protein DFS34DRAFT_639356 [Phlyctochytrium arcticum]|nr:hypothetical protein DFS34DRAFT_639356 [Phlyctochytrium arcticum]
MATELTAADGPVLEAVKKPLRKGLDRSVFINPFPIILPVQRGTGLIFRSFYYLWRTVHHRLARLLWYLTRKRTLPPPYEGVLVGNTGCVWVQRSPSPERPDDQDDTNDPELRVLAWEEEHCLRTTAAFDANPAHGLGLGLWRGGFYGKATLSRGDPTWWARKKDTDEKHWGESLAAQRRSYQMKQKRLQSSLSSLDDAFVQNEPESTLGEDQLWGMPPTMDIEQYQLMPEEAFFLAHAIGILGVRPQNNHPYLSPFELWSRLCLTNTQSHPSDAACGPEAVPFAIRYAAYHYYRSKRWVVKSGIKFGTDFVLYRKGPIFRHADYAVVVIPMYAVKPVDTSRDWLWALAINRVCAQASKKMMLCYVSIPADVDLTSPDCIRQLSVWDVVMTRWIPERDR